MGWREREEVEEETEGNDEGDRNLEKDFPKLRKGNRIRTINKDTGEREAWTVLSLAGKRSSKYWVDSYNVQESQIGDKGWINLRDYTSVQKIEDEDDVLGYENKNVIEAKEKQLQSWRENNVCEEAGDMEQKAISTRWIITEKVKGGERIYKARLVARGFEGEMGKRCPYM